MTPTEMISIMLGEPAESEHVDADDERAPYVGDYESGKTRLLAKRCATCILRPGGLRLAHGRLKEFLNEAVEAGGFVVCHETLPSIAPAGVEPAVCRGFADRYDTPKLRLIRALWGFTEVPPPTLGDGRRATGDGPAESDPMRHLASFMAWDHHFAPLLAAGLQSWRAAWRADRIRQDERLSNFRYPALNIE